MATASEIEKEFVARIDQHQGILHKICFIYARSSDNQKDLYQEIVLQLWNSYRTFEGKSAFSTWMYRVALNTAISYTDKLKLLEELSSAPTLIFDSERSMDYSEEIEILYKAISHLNKIEKAIILLWLEEKTYDEIAEAIGITVKNVSVKLVRIKKKLSEHIERLQ